LRRYEIAIFLTGAVTLALEVLSSRIMTPYFGVSLYIWSGILSITLAFLAFGYSHGGKLSARLSAADLEERFLRAPVISAASITVAALIYPFLLALLSQVNLILGSFVGATLILALPLITLSAMNPLLIGMQRQSSDMGDAGAGRVFFISTVGSVAGVILTAFVLIPNVTNYRAVLGLGLGLTALSAGFAAAAPALDPARKRRLFALCAAVAVAAGLLFAFKETYLGWLSPTQGGRFAFDVRQEYTSLFGNIKVADFSTTAAAVGPRRLLVNDGLIQSNTTADYVSMSHYPYVFDVLTQAYAPQAKDALVLGLGAGVVPRDLKRAGLKVAAVDINADILTAARDYFGFDSSGIDVALEDARTYVRRCASAFDVAIVDLFLGDNTPDYLMTKEFFADLRHCLRQQGTIVVNAYLDETQALPNQRLFATVATAFPNLYLFGIPEGNSFIVATSGADADTFTLDGHAMPPAMAEIVRQVIETKQAVPPAFYAGVEPVSDDHNIFGVAFADVQMQVRRLLARQLSPRMLVN
jgi:spermidine synthase